MKNVINDNFRSQIISDEVKRLVDQFGKAYLDCNDLVKITGLGKDNVRTLMHSHQFPVLTVGNRQIVSIIHFVMWQLENIN